jgi:hypothetical protein
MGEPHTEIITNAHSKRYSKLLSNRITKVSSRYVENDTFAGIFLTFIVISWFVLGLVG